MTTCMIETITPQVAKQMLRGNTRNRKLRREHVDRLAAEIEGGHWVVNGSSIAFDDEGTLLDGQHRLHGVIQADTPIDTIVLRGAPASVIETIDTGAGRKPADVLSMNGYPNAHVTSAAIRFATSYPEVRSRAVSKALTPRAIREIADANRESITYAVAAAESTRSAGLPVGGIAPSTIAAAIIVASAVGRSGDVVRFARCVAELSGLSDGAPELAFVRWNVAAAASRHRIHQTDHWYAFVKALNASAEGRAIKILRVTEREKAPFLYGVKTPVLGVGS